MCLAQEWLDAGAARQDSICSTMNSELALSDSWMAVAAESFNREISSVAELQITSDAPQRIFSFFEYSSSCVGPPLRIPMEPLVGLFRHPFVIRGCNPVGHPLVVDARHDKPGMPTLSLSLPALSTACSD